MASHPHALARHLYFIQSQGSTRRQGGGGHYIVRGPAERHFGMHNKGVRVQMPGAVLLDRKHTLTIAEPGADGKTIFQAF